MVAVSFFEIVSIGAVIPFVGVLVAPEKLFSNTFITPVINFLSIENSSELRLYITILFSIVIVLSAILRLGLLLTQSRFWLCNWS